VATRLAALQIVQAGQNLDQAGFGEVRKGEGPERLRSIEEPIDLLPDGCKDLFLPMLKILEPNVASGAVIDADELDTFPEMYLSHPAVRKEGV
jgi:hypothetical protein